MKQKLTELKGKVGNLTIITGDFNFSLLVIARTAREMINKVKEDLNNTVKQP
jgi:hypothetical protein